MNRKALLVLGMYLVNSAMTLAQNKTIYRVGLTGGINAGFVKSHLGYQQVLWRYNTGIALEQRFSPAFAISYELIYTRQGGKVLDQQVLQFDYAALPIMVRFRPRKERVFLEIGGQVGYLVHNYLFLPGFGNQGYPLQHIHQLDMGLTGGLGYRLGKHFVIDGRYYYGKSSIRKDYASLDPQTGSTTFNRAPLWYNRVYSLNMSYYF